MKIIRLIQPNENYLIDKMILMLITGTGFVNGQYSERFSVNKYFQRSSGLGQGFGFWCLEF